MNKQSAVLAVILTLSCTVLFAGPLQPETISQNANWFIHLDYQNFNGSQLGYLLKNSPIDSKIVDQIQYFMQKYNFHPIDDVSSLTIYGVGDDRSQAVALIEAQLDKNALLMLLDKNPDHQILQHSNQQIHSFINRKTRHDTGKQTFGCLYNDKILLLSTGLDTIKNTIDLLDKKTPNAVSGKLLHGLSYDNQGVILKAAVCTDELQNAAPEHLLLSQSQYMSITIGEIAAKTFCDWKITAVNDQAAFNLNNMLLGFKSMAMLSEKEKPMLAELARGVEITQNNADVNVYFEAQSSYIFEAVQKLSKIKSAKQVPNCDIK